MEQLQVHVFVAKDDSPEVIAKKTAHAILLAKLGQLEVVQQNLNSRLCALVQQAAAKGIEPYLLYHQDSEQRLMDAATLLFNIQNERVQYLEKLLAPGLNEVTLTEGRA
ncbi:MAG: hypothetical protein QM523_00555 [Candidatus Pacebacteria bacterium]|nr:hypothetical protein [Candidatus Paceibacterota bacterium]